MPGLNYSYNVALRAFERNSGQAAEASTGRADAGTADLRSEKLLRDEPDRRQAAQGARLRRGRAARVRAAAAEPDRPADPARLLPPARVHVYPRRGRQDELRRARLGRRPDRSVAARHGGRARRSTRTSGRTSSSSPATRSTPTTSPRRCSRCSTALGIELMGQAELLSDALPARRRRPGQGGVPRRAEAAGFATIAEFVTQTRSQDPKRGPARAS